MASEIADKNLYSLKIEWERKVPKEQKQTKKTWKSAEKKEIYV